MKVVIFLVGILALSQVKACNYNDILGTWNFEESERQGDHNIQCENVDVVYNKQFTFSFPNTVTDELGNTGTFTMVGSMGFEVNINSRSYWAQFYYCDSTYVSSSRDVTVRNWACFYATKSTMMSPSIRKMPSKFVQKKYIPNTPYKNDHEMIAKINSMQSAWKAKAYPEFEKYTVREMNLRAGGPEPFIRVQVPTAPVTKEVKERVSKLPESFDWRDVDGDNYVSPVRDQASCGSCYAFASMGSLEARIRIATKNQRQDVFSTQDIVECSPYSYGCGGGYSYLVSGRFSEEQGVIPESCNTYQGVDGTCRRSSSASCPITYVSSYQYVGGYYGACNEELMMEALVNEGPLPVNYMVYNDFYNYDGGVYYHTNVNSKYNPYEPTNHAVLIVGYGVDDESGLKYWTVKNSWGDYWGENGYFKIKRGVNECSIESAAFSPTVIP